MMLADGALVCDQFLMPPAAPARFRSVIRHQASGYALLNS
jgi:hypothetical protein